MFFFGDSRLFVVGLKSDCCQPPTEQLEILFPFSLIKIKSVELAACSITFRQLTNFVEFELFFSQLSFNSPATLFIHTKLMSVFFSRLIHVFPLDLDFHPRLEWYKQLHGGFRCAILNVYSLLLKEN